MKRVTISLHDSIYEKIKDEATIKGHSVPSVIMSRLTEEFMPALIVCDKCGKVFDIEADEGSLREEGAFCNKHLPEGKEK